MAAAHIESTPWLVPDELHGVSSFLRGSSNMSASPEDSPLRQSQIEAWEAAPLVARSANGFLRRSFMQRSNLLIGVDGPIAAYKTTLMTTLEQLGGSFVRSYVEPAARGNEMLSLFYSNPELFSEPMQFNALRLRFGIMIMVFKDMRELHVNGKAALFSVERMWPWDWAFKRANEMLGRFSKEASAEYENLMNDAWKVLFVPNMFYFIRIDPAVSHERIKRRGRGCEVTQHVQCFECAKKKDPALNANEPGVISVVCDDCDQTFLCEDGPVPLSYLNILDKAQEELAKTVVGRGYVMSVVDGHGDLTEKDFLDIVDKFADDREVQDYDAQIKHLEEFEQRATGLYIDSLARIGWTREQVLEEHRKYLAAEDAKAPPAVADT